MGFFDFFSSTYNPDDFIEKSLEDILNMDSNKIDKNYNFIKDDSALKPTQKKAIFLLKLLKNKLNDEDKKGILNIINNNNDNNSLKSIRSQPLIPPPLFPDPVPSYPEVTVNNISGGGKLKYNKNKTIKRNNRRKHHSRKKKI